MYAPPITVTEKLSAANSGMARHQEEHETFSKAKNFALLLLSQFLAVAYIFWRDYSALVASKPTPFPGLMALAMSQDTNGWFIVGVYGMFVLTLGASLFLLLAMNRFEKWEKSNQ